MKTSTLPNVGSRHIIAAILSVSFLFVYLTSSWSEEYDNSSEGIFKDLSGGEIFNIGIQDSILRALENNPTVSIQRLNSEIAYASVEEQRAAFDPQVTVSANQISTKTEAQLGTRPEPLQLTTERTRLSISISETIPTGTTLSLNSNITGSVSSLYPDQAIGNLEVDR